MNFFLQRFLEYCTWRTLVVGLAATVVAVLAGPFGTYDGMSFGERRVYWALVIGISIIVAITIRVAVTIWLPQLGRNLQDVLVLVVFSFLFTAILDQINRSAFGYPNAANTSYPESFVFVLAIAGFVSLFRRAIAFETTVATIAATPALEYATGEGTISADADPVFPAPLPPVPSTAEPQVPASSMAETVPTAAPVIRRPRLLDRIDVPATASVLRLTVDDHYVIVALDDGTTHRLLMRFADAVAEMAGVDGLPTHRSHWVAVSAISGIDRISGKEMVRLTDGSFVPISRTYRPAFVARGFMTSPTRTTSEQSDRD